jgi:hypothetical protein
MKKNKKIRYDDIFSFILIWLQIIAALIEIFKLFYGN